jgi:hypothetical protein
MTWLAPGTASTNSNTVGYFLLYSAHGDVTEHESKEHETHGSVWYCRAMAHSNGRDDECVQ